MKISNKKILFKSDIYKLIFFIFGDVFLCCQCCHNFFCKMFFCTRRGGGGDLKNLCIFRIINMLKFSVHESSLLTIESIDFFNFLNRFYYYNLFFYYMYYRKIINMTFGVNEITYKSKCLHFYEMYTEQYFEHLRIIILLW